MLSRCLRLPDSAIHAASRRDYPSDVKAWRNLSPDMATARAETMLTFLALLRERLGGWAAYLDSLGVSGESMTRLRDCLLEPGGTPVDV